MDKPRSSARVFIAIPIHDKVRSALVGVQEKLKALGEDVRWTPADHLHLTLLFLGDIDRASLPALQQSMGQIVEPRKPFTLEIKGLGFFGRSRAPRVLWAGVGEGSETVATLHGLLQESLIGPKRATQPGVTYHPHVTLGRVRSTKKVGALTSALASDINSEYGRVQVDHVQLMESQLDPRGAVYTVLQPSFFEGV